MSLPESASNKTNGFAIAAMVNGIVAIVLMLQTPLPSIGKYGC
jgi:hypothetical protein